MKNILDFKEKKQADEWNSSKVDDKVRNICILLAFYAWNFFDKRLTITDIMRTREEQDRIYKKHLNEKIRAKYIKKPWPSVHMFGRGIDIRTTNLDQIEVNTLVKIANTIPYDPNRPRKKTCIYHNVGTGPHLHIQVTY